MWARLLSLGLGMVQPTPGSGASDGEFAIPQAPEAAPRALDDPAWELLPGPSLAVPPSRDDVPRSYPTRAERQRSAAAAALAELEKRPQPLRPHLERARLLAAMRVARLEGRHVEAVELGDELATFGTGDLPADAIALERARARVAAAQSAPIEATQHLKEAAEVVQPATSRRAGPWRAAAVVLAAEIAAMRVLAIAEPERVPLGRCRDADRRLSKVASVYSKHPSVPRWRWLKAQAAARCGKRSTAAAALRRIYIEHAGADVAERAWQRLGELAEQERKIRRPPLSFTEAMERGRSAINTRHIELAREVLDPLADDAELPSGLRKSARRVRAYAAYRGRDYVTCVEDLRSLSASAALRDDLIRCLERGRQYDEAIRVWLDVAEGRRGPSKAGAVWQAARLAFVGGQWKRAEALLLEYAEMSRGHASERRWMGAWIALALGRTYDAVERFAKVERYDSEHRKAARYFQARILADTGIPVDVARGKTELRAIAEEDPYGYYGLWALMRLRALGEAVEVPAAPKSTGLNWVEDPEELDALWRGAVTKYGEAFPRLADAEALWRAGWHEEARRAFRIAADAFIAGRARLSGGRNYVPRSEGYVVGVAWQPDGSSPRLSVGAAARGVIRDSEQRHEFADTLRKLAWAVGEPHRAAKLTPSESGPWASRWYLRAYREPVEHFARVYGVDPHQLWALMYTESRFRPFVVSSAGARGAIQIMPVTGRHIADRLGRSAEYDPDDLFDVPTNIEYAAWYLAELLHKFDGQAPMAYASYNGGPSNIARWLEAKARHERPLGLDAFVELIGFRESRRYTRRVMEVQALYAMMYGAGLPHWDAVARRVARGNVAF